jgi:hypothetical protein
MQTGGKGIENMLTNMVLKKTLKHKSKKTFFLCFIWKWVKYISSRNLVGWNTLKPYNHPT